MSTWYHDYTCFSPAGLLSFPVSTEDTYSSLNQSTVSDRFLIGLNSGIRGKKENLWSYRHSQRGSHKSVYLQWGFHWLAIYCVKEWNVSANKLLSHHKCTQSNYVRDTSSIGWLSKGTVFSQEKFASGVKRTQFQQLLTLDYVLVTL